MALMTCILIALALLQVFIGLAILFESRRSKQAHQKIFVALLTVLFAWTVVTTLLSYVDTQATTENLNYFNLLNKVGFSLGSLILMMMYVFNNYYPVRKKTNSVNGVIIAIGIGLSLLSLTQWVSGNFVFKDGLLHYEYGLFVSLIVLYGAFVLVSAIVDNVRLRSNTNLQLRQQATTLLLGLTLTVTHALVFLVVLPSLFTTNATLYSIGYLAPYYYTSFTAYGLLKQGLFNIRAVVARSAGYVFSLILLVIVYAGSVTLISSWILGDSIARDQLVAFSVVSVFVAILYRPVSKVFNKITNRLFYRDAYDAQTFIDELNKVLVSTIHVDKMLTKSAQLISSTLKTELAVFVLKHHGNQPIALGVQGVRFNVAAAKKAQQLANHVVDSVIIVHDLDVSHKKLRELLEANDINTMIRLVDVKHSHEVMGYIMLGEKKSGSIYSAQDIKVLEIIANELVIAVQNALRFEEIETFNATLQQRVEEATSKLRRTNDKLRQLDETKDDFISMASHQLRTPLTSIKGYISMVLDGDAGKITPMERKLLNQAFISSQRMVYLISDLLNVSRLRTGKFIIEPVPTNMAVMIDEEVRQLQETAKGRGLELTFETPRDFPTLMFDETKMRQVIMNFIDNAIYYTPAGGKINVRLQEKPESIEFTVTDTGIGVPKSEQHKLFTKFYRAHNAKRARPDGTGLGLFMAKKVIMAQGGATLFRSQEGKGSTFGFTFAKAVVAVPETIK